ncbi:protein kinase family protein [Pasteurella bettyae]|uniref:protein kinase family protein n=1 Tax=Pasteurella bettyae TaxID=752 RepID=UPI003D2B4876
MTADEQAMFAQHVEKLLQEHRNERIFRFEFNHQLYWIKQPEVLHGIWKILKPHPKQAFQNELNLLKELNAKHAPVPTLMLSGDNFFVLKDVGLTINQWVENADLGLEIEEQNQILSDAVHGLTELHRRNLIHGRPALRDIAWEKGQIIFMDFEAQSHSQNLEWKKMRDILIFIHGVCRTKSLSNEQIQYVINTCSVCCEPQLWQQVLNFVEKSRCLYYVLLPFKPIARMDLIAIYRLFENMFPLIKKH